LKVADGPYVLPIHELHLRPSLLDVGGRASVAVLALCCVCSQLVVAILAELEDLQRFVFLLLLLAKR
jgi:hypothetical protein